MNTLSTLVNNQIVHFKNKYPLFYFLLLKCTSEDIRLKDIYSISINSISMWNHFPVLFFNIYLPNLSVFNSGYIIHIGIAFMQFMQQSIKSPRYLSHTFHIETPRHTSALSLLWPQAINKPCLQSITLMWLQSSILLQLCCSYFYWLCLYFSKIIIYFKHSWVFLLVTWTLPSNNTW